ncbi:hypothetical protein DND132_2801 [Pseudodesulfovibrio mercurii]|uniref:Uncharacterized protein n=1 Tax=Pseudodesulfovibrio mercurii TaxID=641491 RepID=F0JJA5_9BACT|nr:hypothetical protein [Pseudodesulfovibrio mercurii]EGB16004.1 hypothetical protein DND132_2801 [Pseudodesulfovibrio mercurii]
MPAYSIETLNGLLEELLDLPARTSPAADVNAALRVADRLESDGYVFSLKDLCPRSMDSLWRASFRLGDREFSAEDARSAPAICAAAVAALRERPGKS